MIIAAAVVIGVVWIIGIVWFMMSQDGETYYSMDELFERLGEFAFLLCAVASPAALIVALFMWR